jgi:hypothetical protein
MKAEELVQVEFQIESLLHQPSSGTLGQHRTALPPLGRHVPCSNVVLAPAVLRGVAGIVGNLLIPAFDALPPSILHQHFCHSSGLINEPSLQAETGYAQHRA